VLLVVFFSLSKKTLSKVTPSETLSNKVLFFSLSPFAATDVMGAETFLASYVKYPLVPPLIKT